jgi:hypothetical protein
MNVDVYTGFSIIVSLSSSEKLKRTYTVVTIYELYEVYCR